MAKYPGKRGLCKGVRGNLEFALIADGVAPADVYKTLATSEGVDRAFRKLDQLKPYIVWWDTGAQAAQILRSGDVLMTTAPAAEIVMADRQDHRNFGIQWNAGLYDGGKLGDRERQPQPAPGRAIPVFRRHARGGGALVRNRRNRRPGQGRQRAF